MPLSTCCGSIDHPYLTVSLPLSSTSTYFGPTGKGVFFGDIRVVDGSTTAVILSSDDAFLVGVLRGLRLLVIVAEDLRLFSADGSTEFVGIERFLDLEFRVETFMASSDNASSALRSPSFGFVMARSLQGCRASAVMRPLSIWVSDFVVRGPASRTANVERRTSYLFSFHSF